LKLAVTINPEVLLGQRLQQLISCFSSKTEKPIAKFDVRYWSNSGQCHILVGDALSGNDPKRTCSYRFSASWCGSGLDRAHQDRWAPPPACSPQAPAVIGHVAAIGRVS